MADKNAGAEAASWEKTVEWAFVRKYLPNAEFAAPIDGDHEISDAILAQCGQWFLIEFKHTENDCDSEKDKYPYLSPNRTSSVLRKNYKANVNRLKEINAIGSRSEWFKACLTYEYELTGSGSAERFENDSLLKNAAKAIGALFFKYGNMSSLSKSNLEPHFFVFSRNNKFDNLWALPYWTNWISRKENVRGLEAFDADLIGMYGHNFAAFSDYVRTLAKARGYNVKKLDDNSQNDFKAVVFGRVSGFSRNRTIAMPLDTFLLANENLKVAYELSMPVHDERTPSEAHLPDEVNGGQNIGLNL